MSLILTKEGKVHKLQNLVSLFEGLTDDQISQLLTILKIDEIIDTQHYRSLSIESSTEKILDGSNLPSNIVLTAKLFNYFSDTSEQVTYWRWSRNSGVPREDAIWNAVHRNFQSITITPTDLTDNILSRDIIFYVEAEVGDDAYLAEIVFSSSQSLATVKISAEAYMFVGSLPSSVALVANPVGVEVEKYEWHIGNDTVSTSRGFQLPNALVHLNSSVTVQVKAYTTKGNVLTEEVTIPKIQTGGQGAQGPPGPAGSDGEDGRDGSDGAPGTDAPILRMLEWVTGTTYLNNTLFKDYVYYRVTNKWYKLRDNVTNKQAPNDPTTDPDFILTTDVMGSILAENANIGGWIMRNNMLFSQAGLVLDAEGFPQAANMCLNGLTGELIFGNRRAILDRSGLFFNDAESRPRITIDWNESTGIPRMFFQDETGAITWEAGKNYVPWITQGTTVPSWGVNLGVKKITSLNNDPNLVFNSINADLAKSFITSSIASSPNSVSATRILEDQSAYFIVGAFPKVSAYSLSTNIGYVNLLYKGDMAANSDLIEGYYRIKTPIRPTNLPSDNLLPNGWYMIESVSGYNGSSLNVNLVSSTVENYVANIAYISNGVITREEEILVHTKTII